MTTDDIQLSCVATVPRTYRITMPSHPTPIRFNRILLTGAAGGLGRELRARLKPYCTTVRLSVIADLGEALLEWKNLLALVLVCVGIWLVTRDAPAPKESAPSATPAK